MSGLWIAALWIGALIHVDWHLGRPGHDHRSFDLAYPWILAIPTFAPIGWIIVRKWRSSIAAAALTVVALGAIVGQGLEPLGETLFFKAGAEPFTNVERWRVFAEFIGAGSFVMFMTVYLLRVLNPGPNR